MRRGTFPLLAALLLLCLAVSPAAAADWVPPYDRSVVGVEWNASDSSPALRWIDADGDSISEPEFNSHVIWGNIKKVLLNDSNIVTRDTNPRGDNLDMSGASGKVMTEIPAFYVKSENASTESFRYYRWWISPYNETGFTLHPAFVQRGGTERNNIYVGSYEATLRVLDDGTLALDSRSGEQPWTGYYNNPRDGMFNLSFDGGTTAPAIGATVTGNTSGTAGQVVDLYVSSGSWANSDAAGFLILKQTSGTYTDDEPLTVSGSQFAAADTPNGNAGIEATINTFETAGEALGDGYGAMNVWTYSAIRMLHLVEYANWGSQETVGLGIVSKASGTGFAGEITGYNSVDTNVNEFGTGSGTGSAGYTPASYRTMTDLWGNSWEWVTGYTSTNTEYQIVKRNGTGSLSTHPLTAGSYESSAATPLGADGPVSGWWTSLFHEDLLQYQFIANSVTGGSQSTYGTDYQFSHSPGTRVLLAGGSWNNGRTAGLGDLYLYYAASASVRSSGARLEFTGPATLHGAAPAAQYALNASAGNAPFAVAFTDTSTGSPGWWRWDFGDGNTSTAQSPTYTYTEPGTYTVTQTAYTLYGENTTTQTVEVRAPPVATFTQNATEGNAPLAVAFTDASTGNVTAWFWDFGDGTNATEQSPVHSYEVPGLYTVALNASNPYGYDLSTRTNLITALAPPLANFTANATVIPAGSAVAFTDTSTGNVTAWGWDFGDGTNATEQHPVHTYAAPGPYTVALNASNAYGYNISTWAAYIDVGPVPVANFSANVTGGNTPLAVQFTDTSTGAPTSWAWTFGDGNTSTDQNPSHTYAAAGTYTVTLNASNAYGFNISTQTELVTALTPATASFTTNVTGGNAPQTVQFTDTSTGDVTGWSWTFGDGNTSTDQSPAHTYVSPGLYTVTLNASNAYNYNLSTQPDLITVLTLPAAAFRANATLIPVGGTILFTDASTGNITSWAWAFGDGNTSTDRNATHTYAAPGTYSVTLNASNAYGYNISTWAAYIDVGYPPAANFAPSATLGVVPAAITFTDTSDHTPTSWAWTFGDGNTSTLQNATHTYVTAGTYTVNLTATNAYGEDSETKTGLITLYDPVTANFTADTTAGLVPLAVQFTDTSTGNVTAWGWDFGDGTNATEQHPVHTYTAEGNYTVTLTASNPADEDAETKTEYIKVFDPVTAAFTVDETLGLTPLTVRFTSTGTGTPATWLWDFGDGNTSTDQSPAHTYAAAGTYTVCLTVADGIIGENPPLTTDTETQTGLIAAYDPLVPGFSATPRTGYIPLTVQFTDTSTGFPTTWLWTFGDGTTSALQNPSHTYTAIGLYPVSLTVTHAADEQTETRAGYITADYQFTAAFTQNLSYGMVPLAVQFTSTTDTSVATPSGYRWTFGDGATSTQQHPVHVYTTPGYYTVTLTVYGVGTENTATHPSAVHAGILPTVAFSGTPTTGTAPLTVAFTATCSETTSYLWTFGDGSTSTAQNPSHTYATPGTYTVTLTGTNLYGSTVTTRTDYITATHVPPVASFTAAPTSGHAPVPVRFTDTSTNAPTAWHWDFGDGETSILRHPTHIYRTAGTYPVTLTVTNPGGSDAVTKTDLITIYAAGDPGYTSRYPASDLVVTLDATGLGTQEAVLNGELAAAADTEVWFEYGTKSNSYGFKSEPVTAEPGSLIQTPLKRFPLIAGQTYYYRAACADGYGAEKTFTLPTLSPHPTTTYGAAADQFLYSFEDGDTMIQDMTEATWSPYVAMLGALFFGLVIGAIFINLAMKGHSIAIPALLVMVIGGSLWAFVPPEFIIIAQAFVILGIGGLIYYIYTKRKL